MATFNQSECIISVEQELIALFIDNCTKSKRELLLRLYT